MYRFWVPLAYTDDDVLRSQLQQIADAGGGGIELSPFIVAGAGNQTNQFLAEYGWGTPEWAHKVEVITAQAARLGLKVDQNLGPHYPPTVPTLNSFNQPEAEQQLIFGRQFHDAGTTRTGALPATTVAPPKVETTTCADAIMGATTINVRNLGGLAAGDVITVGSGDGAERVEVRKLGDRLAACAELQVAPIARAHASGAPVVNVARTTRIATLVAQCSEECGTATQGPVGLERDSVVDVTAEVERGGLDYEFPTGNGNPWVVIDFQQTASGLVAQRNGFTATQPNYVVDHWSEGGATIQADFWDESILTPRVKANLKRIGSGAVYEDSLELGESQKWTSSLLEDFEELRGYDLTTLLPALAGAGLSGTHTTAFEFDGIGDQVRDDYRQTMSDLFIDRYVATMQTWAAGHGLNFRVQAYGPPTATSQASAVAGIPEGESLNFGSHNPLGSEENYRVLAGGAHVGGRDLISVECCANFFGAYRTTVAGPDVPGDYAEGGDGTNLGGKYSQGLLDALYKSYTGGVNQVVWHGFPYRDAPTGGDRDGTWPGYNPWDIFNVLSAGEYFGPRQPSWEDYAQVNDVAARTQLVLRQGSPVRDIAVYYEDLGLKGTSVSPQQPVQHMLGNASATAAAGYTWDYLSPALLNDGQATSDDGSLRAGEMTYGALVLNQQTTMSTANARTLTTLAKQGLRIFVIGDAPSRTTGYEDSDADLNGLVADLLKQPNVTRVAAESDLPASLTARSITPKAAPTIGTTQLGINRREAANGSYTFLHNRSDATLNRTLKIQGSGVPYLLDPWSGKITPVAKYDQRGSTFTIAVSIGAHDQRILLLASDQRGLPAAPAVHARYANTDPRANGSRVTARVQSNGTYRTTLNDGVVYDSTVTGLPSALDLDDWTLKAESWTPGRNQWTSKKTMSGPIALSAGEDGTLPSWLEIDAPVDLRRASGLGDYSTTIDLPANWRSDQGAYLSLGEVVDTVRVKVNGRPVEVNQSDKANIDLGPTLKPGTNTLEVRVATTLFNAVRQSGDRNYSIPEWQHTGLIGPITVQPYRDIALPRRQTRASLALDARQIKRGTAPAARVTITASAGARVSGQVSFRINGREFRRAKVTGNKAATRLPRTLRPGVHRIQAVYLGASSFVPAPSRTITVRVR